MTRPALETLFARAAQGQVFLLVTAGGVLLGLLLTGAGALYRLSRPFGMAADVLCALLMGAMLLGAAFLAGDGLRLYALLGLVIGILLWRTGLCPLAMGLFGALQKLFRPRQE